MFSTKQRQWVTGQMTRFPYSSWKDWMIYEPSAYIWKNYKFLLWNIRDDPDAKTSIQLLYWRPCATLDIYCAEISGLTEEDEPAVRAWLEKQVLASQESF